MEIHTSSEAQTRAFGLRLAKKARGGDIFALIGDLGGGKTTFTKGFAEGLHLQNVMASPSFILMKIYPVSNQGTIQHLCHIDAYRMHGSQEAVELGLLEWLPRTDVVTVIEWADKIETLLQPYAYTSLLFDFIDHDQRSISVTQKKPSQP